MGIGFDNAQTARLRNSVVVSRDVDFAGVPVFHEKGPLASAFS